MAFNAVPGIAGHRHAYGQSQAHGACLDRNDAVVEQPGAGGHDLSLEKEFSKVYTSRLKMQINFMRPPLRFSLFLTLARF
jgi:hypothetical protein